MIRNAKVRLYAPEEFIQPLTNIVEAFGDTVVDSGEDFGISFQHDHIFTAGELTKPILNVHFSDTEKLRGCNLMSAVINDEETETAITYHWIDEGIDTGPILDKLTIPISPIDTAYTLYQRCVSYSLPYLKGIYIRVRDLPEGRPNKSSSPYIPRIPLNRELHLTPKQDAFIRSRIFPGKPKPYILINGQELEIG